MAKFRYESIRLIRPHKDSKKIESIEIAYISVLDTSLVLVCTSKTILGKEGQVLEYLQKWALNGKEISVKVISVETLNSEKSKIGYLFCEIN
jgi:hypothetical protein